MVGAWSLILALVFFLQLPQAVDHPVPLPADFDAAKCAECHADKQEGKHVHTAISMGCTTCHAVETKDDVTKISLTAPPPDELCTTCHELQKVEKDGMLHRPYEQKRCIVCHDPHTSDFNAQTRAPMNALCLACHGERPAQGESVALFGTKKLTSEEFSKVPKIVLDHAQRSGHPFLSHPVTGGPDPLRKGQEMSCLSCHLPHAAPLPRLLPERWKAIQVCDECHNAVKAEKEKKKKEATRQ